MREKWQLVSSIFQLVIGLAAIIASAILCFGGENMAKWIVTILLSVAFVVLGVIGIMDDRSSR